MPGGEALCCAREVELNHLRRTGTDQKQQPNVGPTPEQLINNSVKFLIRIGQAREVTVIDDGCGKARFGKDHDPGGRLNEVRAGARAHHQKEGILNLSVQPDDSGEPAEHFSLTALANDLRQWIIDRRQPITPRVQAAAIAGSSIATALTRRCQWGVHRRCLRAMRSFQTNWPALTR